MRSCFRLGLDIEAHVDIDDFERTRLVAYLPASDSSEVKYRDEGIREELTLARVAHAYLTRDQQNRHAEVERGFWMTRWTRPRQLCYDETQHQALTREHENIASPPFPGRALISVGWFRSFSGCSDMEQGTDGGVESREAGSAWPRGGRHGTAHSLLVLVIQA
jgi:hypothetical protein